MLNTLADTFDCDTSGGNLRVSETTSADTRTYLFDAHNPTGYAKPIEEYLNGSLNKTYTLGHQIVTQFDAAHGLLYFLHDGHGSTRALVSGYPAIEQVFASDAFGTTLEGLGLTTADDAYTTWLRADGPTNPLTGLTYLINRDLDGWRFFVTDPPGHGNINNPITLNSYLYGNANPVMNIDPLGLFSIPNLLTGTSILAGLNGIVGATLGGVTGGVRGVIGGFMGGASATFVSVYGTFVVGPMLSFALGGMVGTATELMFVHGADYIVKNWEPRFEIVLAGVVGGVIGPISGGATRAIASKLGTAILQKPAFAQVVARAFANTSGISERGVRRMIEYAVRNPGAVAEKLNGAIKTAFGPAIKDTITNLWLGGGQQLTTSLVEQIASAAVDVFKALEEFAGERQGTIDELTQ